MASSKKKKNFASDEAAQADNKQTATKGKWIIFGLTLIMAVWLLSWYRSEPSDPILETETESATESTAGFIKQGILFFVNPKRQDTLAQISIEIADTPARIERGLMHRAYMPDSARMLFIFRQAKPRSFWMKNTKIPLDLLFVDQHRTIVHIHPFAVPFSVESITGNDKPAQYVVEVNAGFCERRGITVGDIIVFERDATTNRSSL